MKLRARIYINEAVQSIYVGHSLTNSTCTKIERNKFELQRLSPRNRHWREAPEINGGTAVKLFFYFISCAAISLLSFYNYFRQIYLSSVKKVWTTLPPPATGKPRSNYRRSLRYLQELEDCSAYARGVKLNCHGCGAMRHAVWIELGETWVKGCFWYGYSLSVRRLMFLGQDGF